MIIHTAQIQKVGLKWKIKKIKAHPGDIIIWHMNTPFRIWLPPKNPFASSEVLSGETKIFGGCVIGKKGKYSYQMYLEQVHNPEYRWVEGNTPPTIIIH